MKAVDSVAEPPQHGWRHRMGGDVPVQPRIVRKTQHLEQPFVRTPFAVERQPSTYDDVDRVHGDLECGCGAHVEPQFDLESGLSKLQPRKTKIIETVVQLTLPGAYTEQD